jgi:cleavage and polyadenylation specificity factor subunit 1
VSRCTYLPKIWASILNRPSFEFAQNEYVTALECVTLETLSTESGNRDFIAVGTTVNRGEDLAAKGSVSISYMSPLTISAQSLTYI